MIDLVSCQRLTVPVNNVAMYLGILYYETVKLEQGKQYGQWIFEGEYKAPPDRQGGTCHLCGKVRGKIFRFELKNSNNEMVDFTELGSECLKHFDFKQRNPYTNLQGVNTSL